MKRPTQLISAILVAVLCGASLAACQNNSIPPVTDVTSGDATTETPVTSLPTVYTTSEDVQDYTEPVTEATTASPETDATTETPVTEATTVSPETDVTTETPVTDAQPTDTAAEVTTYYPFRTAPDVPVISGSIDGFDYLVEGNGNVTVIKYTGSEKNIIIPGYIEGRPVTKIGEAAFAKTITVDYEKTGLSHSMGAYRTVVIVEPSDFPVTVSIPDTVTEIGGGAFQGCPLESVVIPGSVITIGDYAFYACLSLNKVELTSGLTYINTNAFAKCTAISSISIPNTVEFIGSGAFRETGITEVSLPDSVTELGSFAFAYCYELQSAVLSRNMKTVPKCAFEQCDELANVTIPYGIETIQEFAFIYCRSLEKIELPDSVTHIYTAAFFECFPTSITLSNGLVYVAKYNFNLSNTNGRLLENNVYYLGSATNPHFCLVGFKAYEYNEDYSVKTPIIYGVDAIHDDTVIIVYDAIGTECVIEELVLPEGLRSIMPGAISMNKEDYEISIPESVKYIYEDSISGTVKFSLSDPTTEYSQYEDVYFHWRYYLGQPK